MIFGERYEFFLQTHNSFKGCKIQYIFFHVFFLRRENRSLKMEIIKQTYLAANIKEELRELKRNKQHNANLRTQILVHDSFNIVETTPMSSPSSISWDISSQEIEEKKCNWCKIPFNCFETRKKRLKHISNCKKSVS